MSELSPDVTSYDQHILLLKCHRNVTDITPISLQISHFFRNEIVFVCLVNLFSIP
jgi:hypothetical protein